MMFVVLFAPVYSSAQFFEDLPKNVCRFGTEIEGQIRRSVQYTSMLPLYVKNPSQYLRTESLHTYSKVMHDFANLEKRLGTGFIYDDFTLPPNGPRGALLDNLVQVKTKLDALSHIVDPTRDVPLARARLYVNLGISTLQQTPLLPVAEATNFAVRTDHQLVAREFFLANPVSKEGIAREVKQPTGLKIAVVMDDSGDLLTMEEANETGRLFNGNTMKTFSNGRELVHSMVAEDFMPDVVLTNTFMLSRMGGYTLTAMLRTKGFNKAIIALDAEEETAEVSKELFDQGFDGLISLPKHFTNPEKSGRPVLWEKRLNEALANYHYYKDRNGWVH